MTEVAVQPRLYDRLRRIIPRAINVNQIRHSRERPLHTTAFGCLHVRLVTLAFAWLQTLIHIVILGILALVIINPHVMHHWKMRFHHHGNDEIIQMPSTPDVKQDNVPNFFQNLVTLAKDHQAQKKVIYDRKKRDAPDNKSPFGFFHFVMHSEKTLPQINGENLVLDKTVTIEKGADGKLHSKQTVSVIDKNGHKVSMLNGPMKNEAIERAEVEPHYDMHYKHCRRHRLAFFGLVSLNLFFCLLLVYGVTARRPVYMIPFMIVQLLFLFASSLCVLGYIASLPHIHQWLLRSHIPMKHELLRLNGTILILICSSFILVAYAFKAYMFVVVFRCYKYLKYDQAMQYRMNQVIRQSYDILPTIVIDDSKVKLPEYNEAMKAGTEKNMPPAYASDGQENKAYDTEEEILKN